MNRDYKSFLAAKRIETRFPGLEPKEPHEILFDFQRDIVKWALRRGRACVFADCGMGKTFMQIEWARQIPGNVLILAPLAVANQTIAEAAKLNCFVKYCRHQSEVKKGITIANYEMLEHFDPKKFKGIVLDESSIIKHFEGKFRNAIITGFKEAPFRLACTATPAPNDHMELGNHAEFVGAMSRTEMLSMFFVHDGGDTAKWRLKGHSQQEFWKWVCSWAVMIRKPGENKNPVEGELDRWIGDDTFRSQGRLSIDLWQLYASPVWTDINQSRTLQKDSARDERDERHICPTQLDVIERALELWSNPSDTVLSPFAGIGSEGFVAIQTGRKFIGAELKASYWQQAKENLARAEAESNQQLFEQTA